MPNIEVKAQRKPVSSMLGEILLPSGLLANFQGEHKPSLTNDMKSYKS